MITLAFYLITFLCHTCSSSKIIHRQIMIAQPPNNILFEKMEYKILNETLISYQKFQVKPIASNVYDVNITGTLIQPINTLWFRYVLHRKYMRYQKYLIDIWEDTCAFFDGNLFSAYQISQIGFRNFEKLNVKFNCELKCPFAGTVMLTSSKLNMSKFSIPLLPSARYRLDVYYAVEKNANLFVYFQIFFSISDIRIWFE